MVNESERIRWLRECVKKRLGAARGAPGEEWSADREYCCVITGDHDVLLETDTRDPGGERERTVLHVALNDPRDAIARCESELTMLDMYTDTATVIAQQSGPPMTSALSKAELRVLAAVVEDLARAYRHWPGWSEHWGHLDPNT